jgi:hypothetical protein
MRFSRNRSKKPLRPGWILNVAVQYRAFRFMNGFNRLGELAKTSIGACKVESDFVNHLMSAFVTGIVDSAFDWLATRFGGGKGENDARFADRR